MTRPATSIVSFTGTTVLGTVARAVVNLAKALRHRREIMHLAEFDDRMLKDIGLVRSDVDGALSESLFRNPSTVLVRSVERNTRAQSVARTGRAARPVVPTVKASACCG